MKLLIFDLDGTLIDSAPDLTNAINLTLKEYNKNPIRVETIRNYLGNGAEMLVTRVLSGGKENYDKKKVREFLDRFKYHYNQNVCVETKLYDGVKETLEKLPYKKAIVTNKPHEFIDEILEKLEIKHFFDYYIGGDVTEKKPSPKPLLHVCEKLGFTNENSIMIGDSKNDIIAAKNAKIKSIALTYGYNYGEDISIYNPDIVIDDFRKLVEVI